MTPAQTRFLAFHRRRNDPPVSWHWRMSGEYVQAVSASGDTATVSADEFMELVQSDLVVWIPGSSRIGVPADSNVVSLRALVVTDGGAA